MKLGYTITVATYGRVCVVEIQSNANKPYGCRYVDNSGVSHKVWLSGEELSKNRQKRNRSGNHARANSGDQERLAAVELRIAYGVESYREVRRFVCGHKGYRGEAGGECFECVARRRAYGNH